MTKAASRAAAPPPAPSPPLAPAPPTAGLPPAATLRPGLAFAPCDPLAHRTFEIGRRAWVEAQTGLRVGYVEQLYTFGDRGRHAGPADEAHMVSVGYLALTRMPETAAVLKKAGAGFEPWYRFFPWEDWREKRPAILDTIIPLLNECTAPPHGELGRALGWRERLRLCFGTGGVPWDEEKVLDRYEMLYEAGLIEEAKRDGREGALKRGGLPRLGEPTRFDQPRRLATAIARARPRSATPGRCAGPRGAHALPPPPPPGGRDRGGARQAQVPPGGELGTQ